MVMVISSHHNYNSIDKLVKDSVDTNLYIIVSFFRLVSGA